MSIAQKLHDQNFTLALSSGFFGFYAHVGFLKALEELQVRPSAYAGTSAGAIVGAAAARGLTIREIEDLVTRVSRDDFWDPRPGLGILRGKKLENLLAREIGADFAALQKPLRIPVFDIAKRSTHVFTEGNLARAIRASCAVPVMFHPVSIEKRLYWDGGIQDKMGIHGLSENTLILSHYLESSRRDPHSLYEMKRDQETLQSRKDQLIQVQLRDLPRAHPFAMKRGPEIIQVAYKKALQALLLPLEIHQVDKNRRDHN